MTEEIKMYACYENQKIEIILKPQEPFHELNMEERFHYEVYKKMEEFEKELGKTFFRIHRGFLVNMLHVKSYSRTEVHMDNGDSLFISKYKYPDFTRAYMDFIS